MPLPGFGNTIILDRCFVGACIEAIEASAKRILEESWDSSSGIYSADADADADTDTSEGQDLSSLSSSSSDDSSDIENEISFLQQKQRLLNRALTAMKEEEAYDASKARSFASGNKPVGSSICFEAKEIVNILKEQEAKLTEPIRRKILPKRGRIDERATYTKRLRIDLSSVTCTTADKFLEQTEHAARYDTRGAVSTVSFTGQCIPLILHHHDPRSNAVGELEVMNDPNLGLFVMPPPKLPCPNAIFLKDALSFTSPSTVSF
jgi:hypothetical protein